MRKLPTYVLNDDNTFLPGPSSETAKFNNMKQFLLSKEINSKPDAKKFSSQKMIVIARNPIDVLPSFANLTQLNSHSLETNE